MLVRSGSCIRGLYPDNEIHFHIRRFSGNLSRFRRPVVAISEKSGDLILVPGVARRERGLLKELRSTPNWKLVEKHAFELRPYLHSFLWRQVRSAEEAEQLLSGWEPIAPRISNSILSAYRSYRQWLRSMLRPGQVFLIPDEAVRFSSAHRNPQPYARKLLVFEANVERVVFMPFSSRIERMDPALDVMFDREDTGGRLDLRSRPAVENFPYQTFQRKVYLAVQAAQTVTIENFISSVLTPMGAVRPQLLRFVAARYRGMKTD